MINAVLSNLFKFEWVKTKSPAGATQWTPKDGEAREQFPMRMIRQQQTCSHHVYDGPRSEI